MVSQLPQALREHGLFPNPIIIDGPTTEPTVSVDGKQVIQFCTGNYLGLGTHASAKEKAIDGINKYGLTSSGSRLVSGTQGPQLYLEDVIAKFQNTESAVVYFLVTVANMGIINGFMNPPLPRLLSALSIEPIHGEKEIFYDWLSHPSVVDACRLSVGKENMTPYRHSDMEELEQKLMASKSKIKMIVTDGVFSTDGDLAKLPDIVALSYQYDAMIFVDDAHGTGVLGDNGRGIWEHYHLEDEIDFKVGSLAKAFSGGLGAFIIGDEEFTDYIRVMGGHYIFGGSIPPAIALAIAQNIETAISEPWRRQTVLSNSDYLRKLLHNEGFETFDSETQIIPILIGQDEKAIEISQKLLQKGYYIPAFRYPAVPHNQARLRATMMATHTKAQIDSFVDELVSIAKEMRII
jgi:8-amino-7-oxononanoate synthase